MDGSNDDTSNDDTSNDDTSNNDTPDVTYGFSFITARVGILYIIWPFKAPFLFLALFNRCG
jgi:hypothetical protein